MVDVYLSVGSNIDREENSRSAVNALRERFGELLVSPVYESEPVGFTGAAFFNFIVMISTDASVSAVNTALKEIEDEHGRERGGPKFSSRRLDIDIVTYGDLVGEIAGVTLPRPELYYNAFVLLPMIDLRHDDLDVKTGLPYHQLETQLSNEQQLVRVDFDLTSAKNEAS